MRRLSVLLLASTIAAGAAGAALVSPAVAQDASGPSTSGGSLPYISGREPAQTPSGARPSTKSQATSGSGSSAPTETPAVPLPARAVETPGEAPKPAGEAPKPAVEAAPATKPAGPQRAEKPAGPQRAEKPAEDKEIRVIDLGRPREKPVGEPTAKPAPKPAVATRKPEPKPDVATRNPEPKPEGVQPDAAEAPVAVSKPPRRGAEPDADAPRPSVAERKPARPAPKRAETAARAPDVYRNGPETTAPRSRYGGEPVPQGRYSDLQPGQRGYYLDDEEEVYVQRPRWRVHPYPYVYSYPYFQRPPMLRPYEAPPKIYARPGRPAGDNCHFHAYPSEGMAFHRDIRCHWHEDANDPSLRYAR